MNHAIAQYAGHSGVYFCDNNFRGVYRCFGHIAGYTQGAVAMSVRRGNGDQGYIYGLFAGAEVPGNFAEEHGYIIGSSFIHGFPDIFAHKKGVYLEGVYMLQCCVGRFPFRVNADQAYVFELVAAGRHGIDQFPWRSGGGMYKNGMARLYKLCGGCYRCVGHACVFSPKLSCGRKNKYEVYHIVNLSAPVPGYSTTGTWKLLDGRRLTELCIAEARQQGEQVLGLHTSTIMPDARHIYGAPGFTLERELEPLLGQQYWLYRLNLTQ